MNSWPTLVLIDPEGNYYGTISGEGVFNVLDQHIGKLATEYRAKKMLKETPLDFDLIKEKEPGSLNFPGKVLADAAGNRLFIADSTNHRIVITDLAGKKIAIAGTGKEGLKDGSFDQANFADPQGMALVGDTLYVADRKNHSHTGSGPQKTNGQTGGRDGRSRTGSCARRPGTCYRAHSPWDLLAHGGKLYIAMAGHHQIWTFDLRNNLAQPFAGNGIEELADGPLGDSCFAQPSGLASDGTNLYVADSEIIAIRSVPLNGVGFVKTIVGEGLFEFGDKNGIGNQVRLQHALGVAYRDGKLYVADTYNSKIKLIDPARLLRHIRG